MATKKLQVLANLGPTDAKIKSTVEDYFVNHPIDSTLVDKLTPAFEASGPIVICNPVEGYPLEVNWETKNFAKADTSRTVDVNGGIVLTATKGSSEIVVNGTATKNHSMVLFYNVVLPAGTYTAWVSGLNASDYLNAQDTADAYVFTGAGKKTFSLSEMKTIKISVVFVSGSAYSNTPVKIQIEKGTTATPYEPYNDGTSVNLARCGKNLVPFDESFTFTGIVKKRFDTPLPEGTYTWSCGSYESGSSSYPQFCVTDRNGERIPGCAFMVSNKKQTITTSVPIYGLQMFSNGWAVDSKDVTSTITQAQLELGNTATPYEPYNADTFALGEQIHALPGVNALYANGGLLTVAGRLDPTYAYNTILKKVAALEAAAVSTIPE